MVGGIKIQGIAFLNSKTFIQSLNFRRVKLLRGAGGGTGHHES